MKRIALISSAVGVWLALAIATPSLTAGDSPGKEQTINGEAMCAKCSLKEASKCQTVIQAKDAEGKTVTYYLAQNQVAKDFHDNVCKGAKKVTATGTVASVDGKEQLTATKIELAKD